MNAPNVKIVNLLCTVYVILVTNCCYKHVTMWYIERRQLFLTVTQHWDPWTVSSGGGGGVSYYCSVLLKLRPYSRAMLKDDLVTPFLNPRHWRKSSDIAKVIQISTFTFTSWRQLQFSLSRYYWTYPPTKYCPFLLLSLPLSPCLLFSLILHCRLFCPCISLLLFYYLLPTLINIPALHWSPKRGGRGGEYLPPLLWLEAYI